LVKVGIGISEKSASGVIGHQDPLNPFTNEQPANPNIKNKMTIIIKQQKQAPMPIPHLAPLDIPPEGAPWGT
jgi:hypothetical protein